MLSIQLSKGDFQLGVIAVRDEGSFLVPAGG
jgi:hypothetical protein